MKRTAIFVFCFVLWAAGSVAQSGSSDPLARYGGIMPTESASFNIADQEFFQNSLAYKYGGRSLKGSPFLDTGFLMGSVMFDSNRIVQHVPLRFNCMKNELHFLTPEKLERVLTQPCISFAYRRPAEAGDSVAVVFRNGIPAVDEHTSQTYYQWLAGSEVQLLKYTMKRLGENKLLDGRTEPVITATETYYVFHPGLKQVQRVKRSKEDILQALGPAKEKALRVAGSMSLNYKKEEDLVRLFAQL